MYQNAFIYNRILQDIVEKTFPPFKFDLIESRYN